MAVQRPLTWEGRGEWCPLLPPTPRLFRSRLLPGPHLPPSALGPECVPHRHCPESNVPFVGRGGQGAVPIPQRAEGGDPGPAPPAHAGPSGIPSSFHSGSRTSRAERHLRGMVHSLHVRVHCTDPLTPVRGGKRVCTGVSYCPPSAGRCVHVGACNLLGLRHMPSCTWMWKSFADESTCDMSSCKRLYVCGPHRCGQRGVHGGARDPCGSVRMRVDPGVWTCLCDELFHHPCTTCSGRPPQPQPLSLSKPTARQCSRPHPTPSCMRLAALSIRVCLTKRELTCLGGLCTWPPGPRPCAVISHGASSPAPSTICCSPRSFGLGEGSQVGPPGRALAPHPARSTP